MANESSSGEQPGTRMPTEYEYIVHAPVAQPTTAPPEHTKGKSVAISASEPQPIANVCGYRYGGFRNL